MRWNIIRDGNAIEWLVNDLHTDDIEMAGFGCAHVVTYGMTEEGFVLEHHPVFPTLRTRPNNTHASYQMAIPADRLPVLLADGERITETLLRAELDGTLYLEPVSGAAGPAEKSELQEILRLTGMNPADFDYVIHADGRPCVRRK